MKTTLLITLAFIAFSCSDSGKRNVQPIDNMNANSPSTQSLNNKRKSDTVAVARPDIMLDTLSNNPISKMTLVSSGQMSTYKMVKIDDHYFDLVTQGIDTTYLQTKDKRFKTPEGYKVGTKLSELPSNIKDNLLKEPGWGFYYKLPSGWTLGFCEGNSCTDNYPENNSEVKWIFRRQ